MNLAAIILLVSSFLLTLAGSNAGGVEVAAATTCEANCAAEFGRPSGCLGGCGDDDKRCRRTCRRRRRKCMARCSCGKVTDPCMTTRNLEQCLSLVKAGCRTIISLESCPLQFACGDGAVSTGNVLNRRQ